MKLSVSREIFSLKMKSPQTLFSQLVCGIFNIFIFVLDVLLQNFSVFHCFQSKHIALHKPKCLIKHEFTVKVFTFITLSSLGRYMEETQKRWMNYMNIKFFSESKSMFSICATEVYSDIMNKHKEYLRFNKIYSGSLFNFLIS